MSHSVRSAFPLLRALLLVVMGLSWNGLASDLYARCGGLPRGGSHETAPHGSTAARNRSVPAPLPAQPRCSGPSCSEAPLPAAPTVIAARGGNDCLTTGATVLPAPNEQERTPIADQPARPLALARGLFRPPCC